MVTPAATPSHVPIDESMPKSWFFEIHEDTPEQEAANLMEHSAAVLDISSDDDVETKKRNEELERGKENVPPPDFHLAQPRAKQQAAGSAETSEKIPVEQHVKLPRLRNIAQDAMDEDRKPLGDLPAADFYGDGCDANTYVTVDAGIEKPSGLSKQFKLDCPTPEKERVDEPLPVTEAALEIDLVRTEEPIQIYSDEPAIVAVAQEESTLVVEPLCEPQPASTEVV